MQLEVLTMVIGLSCYVTVYKDWALKTLQDLNGFEDARGGRLVLPLVLFCQVPDALKGMANCPGYHGCEGVWEHIIQEDLSFFPFHFIFFSKTLPGFHCAADS